MAGDKTYIEDSSGNQHRATRTKAVTPESIVWSSNPNDYTVQVRIDGKWHRAILTYDVKDATFFDNINIDKALVTGGDGKTHTALIVSPEASDVVMSSIPTDEHSIIEGTTTGETVVNTYSENWSNVVWQDNVNVYKVLVEGSDGKKHTALLTTNGGGGAVEIIVKGISPISLPDAIANSLEYLKAFGGTEQRNLPDGYTQLEYIESSGTQYIDTGYVPNVDTEIKINFSTTTLPSSDAYIFHSTDGGNARVSLAIAQHLVFFGNDLNNLDNRVNIPVFTANTAYDITVNKDKTIVNGTEYTFTHTGVTLPTMGSMGLFGTRTGNLKCPGRIKLFSCYENNVLKINLIPAKRTSDNVLGMYDTVSGTFFTNAGTGTFTAGGEAVPTPDTPMDIVSNNGALKVDTYGLPSGYTKLEYIESTGTQYIDTGYKPNANTSINIKYYPAVSPAFMCLYGTQDNNTSNRFYGLISSTRFRLQVNSNAGQAPSFWGFNKDGTLAEGSNGTFAETQGIVDLTVDNINKKVSIKSDEYTGDFSLSVTVFGDNLDCTYNMLLLSRSTAGTAGNNFSGRIYGFSIKDNDTLVQNLVPCRRNSDNVVGMYDTVTGTFFTNQGTGDFAAGAVVPPTVYADGTVETINVHGKNLFTGQEYITQGYYLNDNGVATPTDTLAYTNGYTEVKGGTYTFSGFDYSAGQQSNFSVVCYDENKNVLGRIGRVLFSFNYSTFTTLPNTKYLRFNIPANTTSTSPLQLEQGSTATTYQPYFDGGTSTAEMLLKVGDYEDVQEILSGGITRKVGVKVLDGTENWAVNSMISHHFTCKLPNQFDSSVAYKPTYCTHFLSDSGVDDNTCKLQYRLFSIRYDAANENVTTFKQFLADQYANGTPVVIIYPLATPTTESVTGQTMQVQQGDNIVEITQAAIDNLELEAKYQAAVSLTIQEVQDANLDPNVQVTIN